MADYWNRQAPFSASASSAAMPESYWNPQPHLNTPAATLPKRPRPDYDLPPAATSGHLNHFPRDDDHDRPHVLKDTISIGASYDRYLQNAKLSSFGTGESSSNFGGTGLGRGAGGGMPGLSIGDPLRMGGPGAVHPEMASHGRNMGFGVDPMTKPSHKMPLPPDASNTLFVEGLPPDCTEREVAHIFRPFLGFKEVRLVNKEPKYKGGGPLVLCFVDFTTPECAASALSALQGYKLDEHDPDSPIMRPQFARFPTRKSGPRGNKR